MKVNTYISERKKNIKTGQISACEIPVTGSHKFPHVKCHQVLSQS